VLDILTKPFPEKHQAAQNQIVKEFGVIVGLG
jgi:hypothetical protein